ncbi:MAG TPA: translocation/assembly module TamB domain-containing protein, partial [Chitinophagaceae bacterium]
RTFTARSNEFDATVTGQFDLKSLPDAFTRFLHRYYPSYIKPPRTNIPNQNFTFEITTGVVEDYIKLIDPRLSGFNNSYLTGSLNLSANSMTLDANVPFFSFDKYDFNDVQLKADGNFERLLVDGQVINTTISDTLNMPNTIFTIQAQNDISDINITTSSNFAINQANLSAQVKTFSNGVSIKFNPSSFVLNNKTWTIEEGGELDFRKNTVVQGHLVLREANQSIRLSTHPSSIGDWSDLHIDLENINLGDITPLFLKAPRIEGLVSGELMVEDPQKRFNISGAIAADQVRIDNDSIGQIQGSVFYNNSTGLLTAKGNNLDPEKQILFDLALDFKDPENAHRDRISLEPINYPVTILERFIGNLFSDLQGTLTGKLDLLESGRNFVYVGKGRLRNAGLKVNFTQVFYTIDDTEIILTERELNLGTLKLRDKDGATATVRGVIYHNSWQNMVYDIEAEVDDEPMQLINTTYNDNQQFYGRAKGNGFLKLVGPQYDMNMYIEAEPSSTDSSYITIPPSKSRASGSAEFMVERKYGVEMTPDRLRGSTSNITYQVNLTATPMVNLEMILDDLTGDYIRGHGTGNLYLQAGTTEDLTMRGHIDIQDGLYLFTFQSLFKKPFVLRRGGNNYIQWSGDPYDANIRVEAVYTAENVSFAPLASTLSIDQNFARYRGDVNVVALLTGKLFQPEFTFRIEFPENSTARNNPSLAFGIQQI